MKVTAVDPTKFQFISSKNITKTSERQFFYYPQSFIKTSLHTNYTPNFFFLNSIKSYSLKYCFEYQKSDARKRSNFLRCKSKGARTCLYYTMTIIFTQCKQNTIDIHSPRKRNQRYRCRLQNILTIEIHNHQNYIAY